MMNTEKSFVSEMVNVEERTDEPPRKTEGFDSLISEEEFKAIEDIANAMDRLVDIHNKNVDSLPLLGKYSPYQRIQLSLLSDVFRDAQKAIGMMYGIHTCDKNFIDGMAKELHRDTIEELEMFLAFKKTMSDISDILG